MSFYLSDKLKFKQIDKSQFLVVHAAGIITVIFFDREWPDPTILAFNAKSTAFHQEQQQDYEARLEYLDKRTAGDTNLAGTNQISYSCTSPLSNNSGCLQQNYCTVDYFNYETCIQMLSEEGSIQDYS